MTGHGARCADRQTGQTRTPPFIGCPFVRLSGTRPGVAVPLRWGEGQEGSKKEGPATHWGTPGRAHDREGAMSRMSRAGRTPAEGGDERHRIVAVKPNGESDAS